MTFYKRFMPLFLVVGAAITLTTLGPRVAADSLVQLTAAQAGDFHQAITALAEQGHVTLVAEGVPLHPQLSLQDAAKLTAPASLDDEVKAVAAAYDYSAQRMGVVFVLKKRYSDPNDLPALTEAECEHSLVLMQQVTDSFNPHVQPEHIEVLVPPTLEQNHRLSRDQYRIISPLVDPFAASLTLDQLDAMHQNKLRVSSLSQDQQAQAERIQLSLLIQKPMDTVGLLPSQMERAEQGAIFGWHDTNISRHVFGYSLPKRPEDRMPPPFRPLTASDSLENLDIIVISQPIPVASDPTDPSAITIPTNTVPAQTLADAVTAVNARSGSTVRVDIDTAVAAKPVTLVGTDNASAVEVLHALVDVYGLRLLDTPPGSPAKLSLTLPDAPSPSDLAALPSSLRQALPEPFARAIHLDVIVAAEQQFHAFWQPSNAAKRPTPGARAPDVEETPAELEQAERDRLRSVSEPKDFDASHEQIKHLEATIPTLRIAAIRRLRALVEPKLQAKPDGVALAELSEPAHEALATIFLVEATQIATQLLTQAVPDSILHSDHNVLGGGVIGDANHPMFSVIFSTLMPDGRIQPGGGGIGGLDYIKDYGKDGVK